MSVVVTGACGKIGGAVCELLLRQGREVIGLDRSRGPSLRHRVVVETLLDPHAIDRALDASAEPVDAIVHLANHINSKAATPEIVLRENMAMNTSVFMAALGRGIRRVVFSSSIQCMMGGFETDGSWNERLPSGLPIDETLECRPTNVYGLSKLLGEGTLDHLTCAGRFARGSGTTSRLSALSVRLPFVLDDASFARAVGQTWESEYRWGGSEAFAYLALEDAASALARAVDAEVEGHEVVWCAAPDPRSAESVATLIERFYSDVPGADAAAECDSFVSCQKAERLLGWRAVRVLREARGVGGPADH